VAEGLRVAHEDEQIRLDVVLCEPGLSGLDTAREFGVIVDGKPTLEVQRELVLREVELRLGDKDVLFRVDECLIDRGGDVAQRDFEAADSREVVEIEFERRERIGERIFGQLCENLRALVQMRGGDSDQDEVNRLVGEHFLRIALARAQQPG